MNGFEKMTVAVLLSAAVLAGVACSDGSSDSGYSYDDNNNNNQDNIDQDLQQYIFIRHRFVEPTAEIHRSDDKATKQTFASKVRTAIDQYMENKEFDLRYAVIMCEPDGNFLAQTLTNVIDNTPERAVFDTQLKYNLENYSKFMGAILYKIDQSYGNDYSKFQACYSKLAYRAYNDSLGYLQDTNTPSKQELTEIDAKLQAKGVATDYNSVEQCLKGLLDVAAQNGNVSANTLVDAVNLCLLHEGMYGARDLCASAGFQPGVGWLQAPTLEQRTSETLRSKISMDYREIVYGTRQDLTNGL